MIDLGALRLRMRPCQTYSGSKRTFTALLRTMIKKKKLGLVLAVTRRNATPQFCALLPQVSTESPILRPTFPQCAHVVVRDDIGSSATSDQPPWVRGRVILHTNAPDH